MIVRLITAAAVLVSAGVHFKLWLDYKSLDVVGPAFMVNAVAGVVIAVLLVAWKSWLAPLLAVGFGIATLAARAGSHSTRRFAGGPSGKASSRESRASGSQAYGSA